MVDSLLKLSTEPMWIFASIILLSYMLEDLAIVTAAVLAAEQVISVQYSSFAIIIGIISGDVGLYFIGFLANKHTSVKKYLANSQKSYKFFNALDKNLVKNILIIRFVPGLRFIFYTSCGLLKVSFWRYFLGVSIATAMWVIVVFTVIYRLGSSDWLEESAYKWAIAPVALLILYIFNRRYMQKIDHEQEA